MEKGNYLLGTCWSHCLKCKKRNKTPRQGRSQVNFMCFFSLCGGTGTGTGMIQWVEVTYHSGGFWRICVKWLLWSAVDTVKFRLVIMGIRVNGMDSWRRVRTICAIHRDLYGTWFRLLSTSGFHYKCCIVQRAPYKQCLLDLLMWWQQSSTL